VFNETEFLSLFRLIAKLQTLQNINDEEFINQGDPYVELYLDPNCRHSVTIKASLGEMWAQMVITIFIDYIP
jgi:hypothetical protein